MSLLGKLVIGITVCIDRAIQLLESHERGDELVIGLDEGAEPFFSLDMLDIAENMSPQQFAFLKLRHADLVFRDLLLLAVDAL